MIRRPPRSTQSRSSAASDVYKRQEKVVLAQRVSRFLSSGGRETEELEAATNIARALAQDMSVQVRETLAFELRLCRDIPQDLAARIASDVESVSGAFVETTFALSDSQWAGLIPHLEEHAHIPVSYTHLRAHETVLDLVCRLLLEKKKKLSNKTL
eukprot:TRINITY_DN774_c0_g1_i2.p1 TRINITY_DN774_c0_g1~~TRINITY_DN774_c0_g1_i2.p1  ORF type:complete len:156 (+),score=69.20 TRINITY_DN774_c0_g1_i2:123-590(+)